MSPLTKLVDLTKGLGVNNLVVSWILDGKIISAVILVT